MRSFSLPSATLQRTPNGRIWTPPQLLALRSLATRYDCSRISGLMLTSINRGRATMGYSRASSHCFIGLKARSHSRVLLAPVRPVRHRLRVLATVVTFLPCLCRCCCFMPPDHSVHRWYRASTSPKPRARAITARVAGGARRPARPQRRAPGGLKKLKGAAANWIRALSTRFPRTRSSSRTPGARSSTCTARRTPSSKPAPELAPDPAHHLAQRAGRLGEGRHHRQHPSRSYRDQSGAYQRRQGRHFQRRR